MALTILTAYPTLQRHTALLLAGFACEKVFRIRIDEEALSKQDFLQRI